MRNRYCSAVVFSPVLRRRTSGIASTGPAKRWARPKELATLATAVSRYSLRSFATQPTTSNGTASTSTRKPTITKRKVTAKV